MHVVIFAYGILLNYMIPLVSLIRCDSANRFHSLAVHNTYNK